jgi:hypothetical protein
MTTPGQDEVDRAVVAAEAGLLEALQGAFDAVAGLAAVKAAVRDRRSRPPQAVVGSAGLFVELKALCKGRGVSSAGLTERLGPGLRAVCGIAEEDSGETIRWKVTDRLDQLAGELPGDLALAARAALGMSPGAFHPFLGDRVQWLADQLGRDRRTARRRVDDGLLQLTYAAAGLTTLPVPPVPGDDDGWHVQEFHAVLRLDLPTPEAIERRVIVAGRDGIDHITARVTALRDPAGQTSSPGLTMDVLYGATVTSEEHDDAGRMRFVLTLPRPLRSGERHEYAVRFRLRRRQLLRTHYVFISPRRCDVFDLRIHFDPDQPPERIWRLDGLLNDTLAGGEPPGGEAFPSSATSPLRLRFRNLTPGLRYGLWWINAPAHSPQHSSPATPAGPLPAVTQRSDLDARPLPAPDPGPGSRDAEQADVLPADLETAFA